MTTTTVAGPTPTAAASGSAESPADCSIRALRRALEHATDHIAGLDARPVAATATLEELRERLGRPLGRSGIDPADVLDELVDASRGGQLGSAGGRFFAWVVGGSLPAALGADLLTATWDQNAALYACGPAAAVVEEVCGAWLRDLLRLPADAGFALTTGCQLAHVTCLAAARRRVLEDAGWDIDERGMAGSPPVAILTSDQRHGSLDRATRLLGFGRSNVNIMPTDGLGRLDASNLNAALAQTVGPRIVVLQAGDLNVGAFDDFAALVPIAREAGAWVHVDGAFGLWVAADPRRRHLLAGAEAADSWATDAHKWLNVPYDSGIALVRDADALRSAMTHRASYIAADDEARDQIDWNPEWSRRGRGFALWAALRELGRDGLAKLIDRTCRHASALASCIGALDGAELVALGPINQALVRFPAADPDAPPEIHDARTDAVVAAINASGNAFFSGTTWRGRRAMRISVCNWRTTEEDVGRTVEAVREVLALCG